MKDLFVIGWFEKDKKLVVSCEGGSAAYALKLKRAEEIKEVIDGSKIYKLVEVKKK